MRFFDIIFSEKLMNRFDRIERWSNWNTLHKETLPHHSWWVTFLSKLILVELYKGDTKHYRFKELETKVNNRALFHDLDEGFTGDLDHAVKYNRHSGNEMRENLEEFIRESFYGFFGKDEVLDDYFLSMYSELEDDSDPDYKIVKGIVKLADCLALIQYLRLERLMGNKLMDGAFEHSIGLTSEFCVCLQKALLESENHKYNIDYGFLIDMDSELTTIFINHGK